VVLGYYTLHEEKEWGVRGVGIGESGRARQLEWEQIRAKFSSSA
jgi:hypothetical protein